MPKFNKDNQPDSSSSKLYKKMFYVQECSSNWTEIYNGFKCHRMSIMSQGVPQAQGQQAEQHGCSRRVQTVPLTWQTLRCQPQLQRQCAPSHETVPTNTTNLPKHHWDRSKLVMRISISINRSAGVLVVVQCRQTGWQSGTRIHSGWVQPLIAAHWWFRSSISPAKSRQTEYE